VLGGFVSAESARADYGVVIDPETGAVDGGATRQLRATMRGPVGMFHRGGYFGPPVAEGETANPR
jgi:N-methylhydantoinase B